MQPRLVVNLTLCLCLAMEIMAPAAFPSASASNILFYFGMSGHSHISSIWPAIELLGDRGHNITLLTSIPPKSSHPAVTSVFIQEMFDVFKDVWDEGGDLIADRFNGKRLRPVDFMPLSLATCSALFSSTSSQVQSLLHGTSFDLVIMDTGLNECALGLAILKYNSSFMIYNALSNVPGNNDDFGIPFETSWVPDIETGTPIQGFVDRVVNTWLSLKFLWARRMDYFPKLAQIFAKNLHLAEVPNFVELQSKTSLMLLNGFYTHGYSMSLPPFVVPIAGVGISEKRNPLPEELAKFVTESGPDGFIYVSFGTAVTISKGQPELRRKFFEAFGRASSVRFVWKWEGEIPTDAPPNIYFSNWLPQQDLLAHPKIRGYIGHAGNNGVNEGVCFGVPMILFPILADQDFNANAVAAKGLGLVMEITDFTPKELQDNINVILHDEGLKARVKRAATVFNDRPQKPVDTAVWWIEFVLRHKDTSFLMPGGVTQTWYQRRLLDVWFFIYTLMLAAIFLVSYVGWKLLTFGSGTEITAAGPGAKKYPEGGMKSHAHSDAKLKRT